MDKLKAHNINKNSSSRSIANNLNSELEGTQQLNPPIFQLKANPLQEESTDVNELEKDTYQYSPFTPPPNNDNGNKNNQTELPENVKRGAENLSEYSMDDVKVHYNSSKPAQLRAYAFTQRDEIHVGPGQEKHLPHEDWHVVQQKKGRVSPTSFKSNEIQINDDVTLEKEADIIGDKIQNTNGDTKSLMKAPELSKGIIQRKMGFEFESGANKILGESRKFKVYEDNQFSLEADTKEDVEFVTKPFEKKSQLLSAVSSAANFAKQIADNKNSSNHFRFGKGGNVKNDATILINDDLFKASAQSTEGVKLEDLSSLIDEHIGGNLANWSKDDAKEVLKEKNFDLPHDAEQKVNGLIQYIALYIRQVKGKKDERLSSQDGPKAYFRLMARSDFNSMFRSIIPYLGATRGQKTRNILLVKNLVKDGLPGELEEGFTLNDFVFAQGKYYAAGEGSEANGRERAQGPRLGDWIDSIFTDAVAKDLMSPPIGYGAHQDLSLDERYGMGAYDMDEDKVLIEMRGYRNKLKDTRSFNNVGGKVPFTEWRNFAEHYFNLARQRNNTLKNE